MLGLDVLPWPWGEDILAGVVAAVTVVRAARRRTALAWAAAQRPRGRWRLAAAVCAFRGRWVARMFLLGLRSPDDLRAQLRVEGEEHLTAVPGGAILLTFHLGPPTVHVPVRLLGHSVRYVGRHDRTAVAGWFGEAWRPLVAPTPLSSGGDGGTQRWVAVLDSARKTLLGAGKICIMADGGGRQVLFRIELPGEPMIIRPAWWTLHRLTGVPVLPATTHLEGRKQVVTIHPPLPMQEPDPARRLEAWRGTLTSLVADYVRRFPEQCPALAVVPADRRRNPTAGAAASTVGRGETR
jgi:hypothetical protein